MSIDHNEMIAIIQAHSSGKQLQFKERGISELPWVDLHMACFGANFERYEYRIKPEPPKPREWDLRGHSVYHAGGAGSENALADVGWEFVHVREVLP